ncbi:hypothetical protein QAD02_009707 [Eretmocerus hayati]|uniref:Uncharacterized protein n=1 Tax=Eretmocerus hayati TaxID=131215 RepID=A0ACC2NCJ0_9HYME|nr:hypothetical protein QAD02_009707 [Eretmocerus hayati]
MMIPAESRSSSPKPSNPLLVRDYTNLLNTNKVKEEEEKTTTKSLSPEAYPHLYEAGPSHESRRTQNPDIVTQSSSAIKPTKKSKAKKQPAPCNLCGKMFADKYILNKHHMRFHETVGKYPCEICHKVFKGASNLNAHKQTHTDEKLYKCEHCKSCYKNKRYLMNHIMSLHLSKKFFSCKICSKSYKHGSGLNRHMRVHKDKKPHSCEICGKNFRDETILKTHMVTHTGEKKFSCKRCDKSYTQKYRLDLHTRTHQRDRLLSHTSHGDETNVSDTIDPSLSGCSSQPDTALKHEDSFNQVFQRMPETCDVCLIPNSCDEQREHEEVLQSYFQGISADRTANPEISRPLTRIVLESNHGSSCHDLNAMRNQVDRVIEQVHGTNPRPDEVSNIEGELSVSDYSEMIGVGEEIERLYREIVMQGCNEESEDEKDA